MTGISTKFVYTTMCSCSSYDEETDENIPSEVCYGDCWEETVEDFTNIVAHLFEKNERCWWKIKDLALWDGNYSGYFYAEDARDLIKGMTVNSEWIMRGEVFDDRIEYSLSHHDAMGSSTVLEIMTEDN
jgi:hypothetical protein